MSDITIRTATSSDFPGMLALLVAAFADGRPAHARFDQMMPETIRPTHAILDNWYIAVRGTQVIASTQIVDQRFVVAPGVEMRVGGIGQVCCLPDFRGQGLMSALLNTSIVRMTNDGYHISILGGDRLRYRRYGWEIAGSGRSLGLTGRRIDGKSVLPADGNRPTRWLGDQVTEDLIHHAHQCNVSRMLRSREQTHLVLERINLATWVHRSHGGFAYLCLNGDCIAEYGGDCKAFEELLGYLLAKHGLSATIPAEEGSGPLEDALLQFAGNYSLNAVGMIRVFQLKPLLELYRPILEQRLACWQGSIVLEMADDGERVQVGREGSRLTISECGKPADLKLCRPDWAPTLFGPFPPPMPQDARVQAFVRQAFGLPVIWPGLSQI